MVYLCNSIAVLSERVTVEVIDAGAFPDLVTRFEVGIVPKIVINGTVEVLDSLPAGELIARIAAADR